MAGQSFADIYSKWEQEHDEKGAINKKIRSSETESKQGPTISQVRSMKVQDELDLHEMILEDAIKAVNDFRDIRYKKGFRKVRIITGKGLHSDNGTSVLRPAVIQLVNNHPKVRETFVPKASEGGSGALSVILKA